MHLATRPGIQGDDLEHPRCGAHQHERWIGTGDPDGLVGEAIPLPACTFAVVDVCDALASDPPYREAWTHGQAVERTRRGAGNPFDPRVARACTAVLAQAST